MHGVTISHFPPFAYTTILFILIDINALKLCRNAKYKTLFKDSYIPLWGQIIGPTLCGPTLKQTDLSTDRMVFGPINGC